jgi:hypothetical protein
MSSSHIQRLWELLPVTRAAAETMHFQVCSRHSCARATLVCGLCLQKQTSLF